MTEQADMADEQRRADTAPPTPSAMPDPPFPDGSRVRCLISTRTWNAGIELCNTTGTVVRSAYYERSLTTPFWDIVVAWDNAAPQIPFHHAPEELELAGG
jgi:hypothetical protein